MLKKSLILIIMLSILVFPVLFTGNAQAGNDLEVYAGGSFNTFSDADESGIGFYSGTRQWISEDLAVGGELDFSRFSITFFGEDISYKRIGFLGTGTFKLTEEVSAFGAAGIYRLSASNGGSSYSETEFGAKFGIEGSMFLDEEDDYEIMGRLNYRIVDVNGADWGGVEIGIGAKTRF